MNSSNASNYDQRIERADLIGQQFSHNHNLNGNVAGSNMFPSIGMPSNIPYFQENAPPHYNYIIAEVPYHDPVTQVTESREFVEMHTVTGRGGTSRRMETSHSSQFVMQPENGNICQIQTMRGIISTTSQNASSTHFTSSSQLRNVYPFETVETTPEYGFSTQYTTSSQMMNVCQYQMDEHPTFNTQNPYSSPFVASSQSSSLHQSQTRTYTCTEADSLPENVHELQTAQAVSKNMNVSSSFMAHEVQQRQLQGRHTMNRNVKGAAACSRKRVVSGFGLSDKQQMKTMRVSAPRVVPKNIKQRVPPDHNGSTHITDQTASTSEKFHSPVNCGTQPNLQTVEKFEPLSWTKTKPPISYAQRLVIEDDLNKVQQCHSPVNCYTQPHPEIVYELEPIRWTQTKPMISYAQRMVIEDNINHAPDLDKSRYSSTHNSKDFSKSQVSHGIGTANYTKLNTPIVIELSDSVDDDIVEICPSTSTTTVSKLNHLDIQAHSTSGLVQDIVNEHALQHEIVSSTQPCDSPLNKKVKTKRTCKVRDAPVRRAKKSMQVSDESSDGSYKLKYVSLPKRVSLRKKETPFYMEFSSSDESNKNVKNRTNVAKANIGLAVDPDSSGMMVRDQSKNETEEIADHSSFGAIVETLEGSSTNTLQNKKANSSKSFSKNIYDTSSDEFTPFEKNIRKKKTKKKVRASTETVRQKRSEDTSPHLCEIDAEKSEEKRSSARQKNATSYLEMSSSDESYIEFPKIRLRIVDHCNSSDDTVVDPSEPHLTDRLPIHSKSPSEDHLKANINGRNKKTNYTVDAIEVDGLSDEYLDNGLTSEPTTTPISENRRECFTRAAKAQEEASCTSRTAHSEANGHIQNCDTKSVEAISNAFSGSEEVVREETIVRNRKNRTTLLGVFAEYSSTEDEEYEENKRKIIESSRFKYLLDCDEDELNELLFDIPEINVTGLKRIEAAQESKTVPDQKNTPAGSANQLKTKEISHKATNHKLSPEKAKIASTSSVSQTTIAKRPNRKGKVVTCSANDENPYAKVYAPSAEYRRRSAVSKDRTTSSPISKECPKTNAEPPSNVNSAGKKKVLRKKASAKKENICDNALSSDDSDEGPKTTNRKPSPIIRKPMNMRRCARLDAIKELRAGLLEKTKANVGVQEEEAKATSKLRPKSKPTPPSESDSNSGSKSKSKLESESESEESDSLYKPARGASKKPFVFLQDTSTDESYSSDPPSAPSGYATECSENAVADVVFEGIEVTFPKSEEKEIEKMLNKVSRSRFKSLLAYKEKNLSRVLRYVPEQNVRGLQRLKIEHADVYARICKSDKPDFEIPIEMACDSTWNRKATKNMILEYVFSNFQFTAPREMVLENFERDFTHMVSVKELKFVTSVRGTIWYYHFRSPRASLQDHLTLNGTEEELAAFFKTEEEEVTDYSSNESCDENGINPFQIRKIRVPPPVVSSSESEYVDSSVDDDDIGDFNGPARLSDELKPLPRKQVKKNMKKHLPADPDLRTPQESDFNKFLMYSEIQLMEALERLQEVDVTGIPRFDPPNLDIVIELTNHPPRFENAILEALDATPTGIGKLADIFEYIISRYHFNLDIPLAYEYVQDALKLLVNCKYLELHGREGKLGYRLDKAKKPKGVFIPGNLFLREAEIGFINGLREALTKFHTPKGNFMQTLFIDVAANNWCENNMERSVSIFKGMTRLKRRGEVRETKKGRYILTKKYRKFYWKRERRSKRGQKRRKP